MISRNDLNENKSALFLNGGGEMGELIRGFDWAGHYLGLPETWPQSLKTTLSIILNSRFPMFLFWGPDSICFYNDAYRPSLGNNGKHPGHRATRRGDLAGNMDDYQPADRAGYERW